MDTRSGVGVYGSAIAYSKLGDEKYREVFRGITDYFLEHLPSDLIPYWDFDFSDGSNEPRDSSAAVIAVCGIEEMIPYLNRKEAEYYHTISLKLMKAIIDKCAVKDVQNSDGLILHGTYSKKTKTNTCTNSGVDECTTWGDYFYLEALLRLKNEFILNW